jgi:hypothetical protein
MENPQVRPGKVIPGQTKTPIVAFFHNSAQGNSAIQQLIALGIPNDRLGITPPERTANGQGMVLSIACPTDGLISKVESLCRSQGASIYRQRA